MSKKSSQVKIGECSIGDVCWIVLKQFSKPLHGEVVQVIEKENAVQVMTNTDGFRTVVCEHCFWEENDAKSFKKNMKK